MLRSRECYSDFWGDLAVGEGLAANVSYFCAFLALSTCGFRMSFYELDFFSE